MNNHIIANGKAYECKNDLETLNKFLERWNPKIKEIKESAFSGEQCNEIVRNYITEAFYYFSTSKKELEDTYEILEQLYHEITLAIFISYSKYQRENKKFRNLFWKDKLRLPNNLHFHNSH